MSAPLLVYYSLLILVASVVGGLIPSWVKLTHRRMEFAVSFVAGVMLGVALLHMLPHAILSIQQNEAREGPLRVLMLWTLGGFLAMFFIERFFCFHHHEAPASAEPSSELRVVEHHPHDHSHTHCDHEPHSDHNHSLSWTGAALGLTLHGILEGVALAASVAHGHEAAGIPGWGLAGLGTFLVIFLHKPLDSLTIGTLMHKGRSSISARSIVNGLFALTVPLGALLYLGLGMQEGMSGASYPLAFSAGTFLCIAMSDLLPELQFHHHDRVKLSAALIAGLAVAYAAGQLEAITHAHP